MKLSVITINYNNLQGLADTIKSVEAQSVKDFEWVVVDGGSTDGSRELIEEHSESIDVWVSEPDAGIYNAMNKGIRMSTGDYLLFLNSGDLFANEQVVEKVIPALTGEDFIVGSIFHSDKLGVKVFTEKDLKPERLAFLFTTYSFPHQSTFTKRSVFDRYGLYREDLKIVSDWVLLFQALVMHQASAKYIPVVVSIYDVGGVSAVNKQLYNNERDKVMKEWKYLSPYIKFYKDYYEMVHLINNNKLLYGLFRVFFYFNRKSKKK